MVKNRSIPENIEQKFYEHLENLITTPPVLAEPHLKKLLSTLDILTDSDAGIRFLYDNIVRLTEAGLLADTMWEKPARLVPALVGGTLKAGGQNTIYEIISELRMAAIARGKLENNSFRAGKARTFLEETMVNNLDLMFPSFTGQVQPADDNIRHKISSLFSFLTEIIPVESIKGRLSTEIELICLQRPIVTDRVLQIIRTVKEEFDLNPEKEEDKRLLEFVDAVFAPSRKAGELDADGYRDYLKQASDNELENECRRLSSAMHETGLATGYHALLLQRVAEENGLIKKALGLGDAGKAELDKHRQFVKDLIRHAIHADTARSCYGLANLLDRSLLSHQPVKSGLERLLALDLHPDVGESIRKSRPASLVEPAYILAAECLGILGQPLGIGQGWNPTCQAARGISLWSSHAPGKLLRMIESAAKGNRLRMRFEGQEISSDTLLPGLAKNLDYNLDAVSVVLVPHLDKIYNEMMRRASNRGEDPHKWVNPAMYGHWIPTGFISAYDYLSNSIKDYETFIRTFYATHHPDCNGGHNLAYPNPVGIFLTSSAGKLIGFHAVSVLRVRKVKGQTRVFMLNPNNEGRQRWQDDIKPTVAGNGEQPGESSLPFHQFASRIYAFHYNPEDLEDTGRVDSEEIRKVEDIAKGSWGESYTWIEAAGYPV
ncbi:MAG: hypothetical protein WD317_00265 [Balneolaceae bacterium]